METLKQVAREVLAEKLREFSVGKLVAILNEPDTDCIPCYENEQTFAYETVQADPLIIRATKICDPLPSEMTIVNCSTNNSNTTAQS